MRRRTGDTRELANRAELSVLKLFVHMERMENDCLVKGSIVRCEVERKATNGMNGRCEKSAE